MHSMFIFGVLLQMFLFLAVHEVHGITINVSLKEPFELELDPGTTISSLKQIINERTGVNYPKLFLHASPPIELGDGSATLTAGGDHDELFNGWGAR